MHYHTPLLEPVNARKRPIFHHHSSRYNLVTLTLAKHIAELLQRAAL
jgi:hypothetical protein